MTTKNFNELLTDELDSLSFLHNDKSITTSAPKLFNPNNIKETTSNIHTNNNAKETTKAFKINSKPNTKTSEKKNIVTRPINISATSTDSITKKYRTANKVQQMSATSTDNHNVQPNQQFSPTSTDNSQMYAHVAQDGGAAKKNKQNVKSKAKQQPSKKNTTKQQKKVNSPVLTKAIEDTMYDSDDFINIIKNEKAVLSEHDSDNIEFEFHNRLSHSSDSINSDSFSEPVTKKYNKSGISVPFITGSRLIENTVSDNSSMSDLSD